MTLVDRSMRCVPISTISAALLLALPINTYALSCVARLFTLSEAYEAADSIIVGLVTECEQEVSDDPWADGGADCSFVSLEVLKESVPARDYRGITSSSGCGLSLHIGNQYLLFLDSENRPMHFSAGLISDDHAARLSNDYVRILRDYRNGVSDDLSEPWMFGEFEDTCVLSHGVRGNQISFSHGKGDAAERAKRNWARETVDGKAVYRSMDDTIGAMEVVVTSDLPTYPDGVQMLSVSLPESSPAPLRHASLSVGTQSWSLYRVAAAMSIRGMPATTTIDYKIGGAAAEQILAAMMEPSDIVVTATLAVTPDSDSSLPDEDRKPGDDSVTLAPVDDDRLGPAPPETNAAEPEIVSGERGVNPYRDREEPPKTVLRMETRSTHLANTIERYRACYSGEAG